VGSIANRDIAHKHKLKKQYYIINAKLCMYVHANHYHNVRRLIIIMYEQLKSIVLTVYATH